MFHPVNLCQEVVMYSWTLSSGSARALVKLCLALILLPPLTSCPILYAKSLIEKREGEIEVDWGKNIVTFYGRAVISPGEVLDYAELEQKSWNNGLLAVSSRLDSLIGQRALPNGGQVARKTYSRGVKYFRNGVEVILVSGWRPPATDQNHPNPQVEFTPPESVYGGLIINCPRLVPRLVFKVFAGKKLVYSNEKIIPEALAKNSSARWFVGLDEAEKNRYLGSNVLKFKAKQKEDGNFYLDKTASWTPKIARGLKKALANGQVIFNQG